MPDELVTSSLAAPNPISLADKTVRLHVLDYTIEALGSSSVYVCLKTLCVLVHLG